MTERYRNMRDCINAGKALVEKEKTGKNINYREAAAFALNVVLTMSSDPHLNRQIHDNLYKYVNSHTRIGWAAKTFFGLAKQAAGGVSNLDMDWLYSSYRNAGIVGDEPHQISEYELTSFVEQAARLQLPAR